MKVVISLLILCYFASPVAVARNLNEALRENLTFCSQFVIHDPDPNVVFKYMRDCCALSQNIRDCQMYDLGRVGR